MALVMNESSGWWYARLSSRGKLRLFPLMDLENGVEVRIPVKGKRPSSLRHPEEGDKVFQNSHARAKAAHDRLKQQLGDGKAAEVLADKLLDASTGEGHQSVLLKDMDQRWADLPRKNVLSDAHRDGGMRIIQKFRGFVLTRNPRCEVMGEVTKAQVEAFLGTLVSRGLSNRTWNVYMGVLKQAYRELAPFAPAYRNGLQKAKRRTEHTIHREPFTDEELEALLNAARKDEVLSGPVLVSAYTGLRRGDACTLEWAALKGKPGFLKVCTRKNKETALIPILPELASELERHERTGKYVFPQAAELYLDGTGRNEVTSRFSRIMERAGIPVRRDSDSKPIIRADIPRLSRQKTDDKVREVLAASHFQLRKKRNMQALYTAYADGQSVKDVARDSKVSVSTVSKHLNDLEKLTRCVILRGGSRQAEGKAAPKVRPGNQNRGAARASTKGWHSLRTTFVTRALQAGMPEELLRKVTGHATVDVVRENYFNPSDEVLAEAFSKVPSSFLISEKSSVTSNSPRVSQDLVCLAERIAGMDDRAFRGEKFQIVQELERLAQNFNTILEGNNG